MINLNLFPITELELKPGNYGVVLCKDNSIEPVLVSVSEDSAINFMELNSAEESGFYTYLPMWKMSDKIIKKQN